MKATSAAAILQVSDLDRALTFYRDVLGFAQEFVHGEPPFYAAVKRDEISVHLCSAADGAARVGRGSVYLFCDVVDAYCDEVTRRGAIVTSPLNTQPYGMRDFQIKDLDGNLIGFGCPVG